MRIAAVLSPVSVYAAFLAAVLLTSLSLLAALGKQPATTKGTDAAGLPTPRGATAAMVAEGDRLYHANTCVGCHGFTAEGTTLGSSLTRGTWLWGDGSVASIARTITEGVPKPKEHTGVMPPMGGAQISSSDVSALAAYIAALNQRGER